MGSGGAGKGGGGLRGNTGNPVATGPFRLVHTALGHKIFHQDCEDCVGLLNQANIQSAHHVEVRPDVSVSDDSTSIVDTLATVAAIEAVESIFSSGPDPAVSSSQDFTPADTSSSNPSSDSSFDGFSGGDSGGGGLSGDF